MYVLNNGATFWILGYKTEGAGNHGLGLFYTKNGRYEKLPIPLSIR
jgi:hypothetical protein